MREQVAVPIARAQAKTDVAAAAVKRAPRGRKIHLVGSRPWGCGSESAAGIRAKRGRAEP